MTAPVIGITTYLEPARWGVWDRPAALLPRSYVDGVARAGGAPVLLPPACPHIRTHELGVSAPAANAVVRAIDGLVLSGGADVDPARYGEPADPRTVCDPDRDGWELAVLDAALRRGLPVLAICRGMQLLNVACGGSLHQHLPDVVGTAEHQPSPGTFGSTAMRVEPSSRLARTFGSTAVRVEPASRLAAITGGRAVSCHHHQAVRRLGDGLVAAAWAHDGTVEAIEHSGHDFVLGVQWHPEEDAADARLFQSLVRAASRRGARLA